MRKSIVCLTMLSILFFGVSYASANDSGWDTGVKTEYLRFTDDIFKGTGLGNAVYFGAYAYKQVFVPNLYLGLESGWAGSSATIFGSDIDVNYVPVEINAKYVVPFGCNNEFNWFFGGGGSYNYFNISQRFAGSGHDDWVAGGQAFTGFNYNITKQLYVGLEAKYQMTQDIHLNGNNIGGNADNLRTGLNLGWKF